MLPNVKLTVRRAHVRLFKVVLSVGLIRMFATVGPFTARLSTLRMMHMVAETTFNESSIKQSPLLWLLRLELDFPAPISDHSVRASAWIRADSSYCQTHSPALACSLSWPRGVWIAKFSLERLTWAPGSAGQPASPQSSLGEPAGGGEAKSRGRVATTTNLPTLTPSLFI